MAIIEVTLTKLPKPVKDELVQELIKVASETSGIPKHFFSISIYELEVDATGIGGTTVEMILDDMSLGKKIVDSRKI